MSKVETCLNFWRIGEPLRTRWRLETRPDLLPSLDKRLEQLPKSGRSLWQDTDKCRRIFWSYQDRILLYQVKIFIHLGIITRSQNSARYFVTLNQLTFTSRREGNLIVSQDVHHLPQDPCRRLLGLLQFSQLDFYAQQEKVCETLRRRRDTVSHVNVHANRTDLQYMRTLHTFYSFLVHWSYLGAVRVKRRKMLVV